MRGTVSADASVRLFNNASLINSELHVLIAEAPPSVARPHHASVWQQRPSAIVEISTLLPEISV